MVIKKAHGCKIIDSNGNSFIDTTMACGVQIIGHNNKLVRKIAKQVLPNVKRQINDVTMIQKLTVANRCPTTYSTLRLAAARL